MLSSWDHTLRKVVHRKINSCLTPVFSLAGSHVTTVEGLVKVRTEQGDEHVGLDPTKDLHPIQQRIAECHGSQCGFCSPGMVNIYELITYSSLTSAFDL